MAGLVVALNPAVDVEWRLAQVVPEEKNELEGESRWPGGKGVNVARWLQWLGCPARVFLPLGGDTGKELAAGLRREGLRFTSFRILQPNRANVVVTPRVGPQFRFNATWPRLGKREAGRLKAAAIRHAALANPLVISGTLAFGAPPDTYAAIVSAAVRQGRRVFIDCDREPFARAAKERPFLVKPNEHELGQWEGRKLRADQEVLRAARKLASVTGGWVLVSRGSKGALLVSVNPHEVVWEASVPPTRVRNAVGAGDALLAGVIATVESGLSPEEWLRRGVATGTAATQVAPGRTPSRAEWRRWVNRVSVRRL